MRPRPGIDHRASVVGKDHRQRAGLARRNSQVESSPLLQAVENGGKTSSAQQLATAGLRGKRGFPQRETLVGAAPERFWRHGNGKPEIKIFRDAIGIGDGEDEPVGGKEIAFLLAQGCVAEIGHWPGRSVMAEGQPGSCDGKLIRAGCESALDAGVRKSLGVCGYSGNRCDKWHQLHSGTAGQCDQNATTTAATRDPVRKQAGFCSYSARVALEAVSDG